MDLLEGSIFFKARNEHSSSWETNLIMYLKVEEEVNTEEKGEKCTHAHKQQSKGVEGTAQGHSCGDS